MGTVALGASRQRRPTSGLTERGMDGLVLEKIVHTTTAGMTAAQKGSASVSLVQGSTCSSLSSQTLSASGHSSTADTGTGKIVT